ncbi:MAG: pitrilysin family protein, partial [Candidatus Gastranaerophilales bacterium]|nr:pitrilysin family protein [Candidatus Gastranaerophilales bacterium]
MVKKISKIVDKQLADFPFLDKQIELYTLENGHTIVLANKKGELVNVSTWVKTGSINEDDKISGISHFLEHLMFKGTELYPAGYFDKTLESKGAIVNAATWKDYTFYYVTLPKGENNQYMNLAIELHGDMMVNSIVPEEEIGSAFDVNNPEVEDKRERYVVIEEIRMRLDQPWTKTYNELNHNMYKVHPYKRDVIGTPEIIATVSRDTIMDYYKKWYTPKNMTTIIVGDFDSEEVLRKVRENFLFDDSLEQTQGGNYPQEDEQTEQIYLENTANVTTGFLMVGFKGPKALDLKNSIALDALAIILGDGKSSRLYRNLIEKPENPVFNIVGAEQYQFKDGNNFFVQGNYIPDKKDEAIELIKNELKEIVRNSISDKE